MVLQHGFNEHAARFRTQHHQLVDHLLDHDIEVWAMDLLGHGESPGATSVTDVRAAVRDHVEVRRRAGSGGLPVILVGHSLGGLVTAGSLVADPSRATAVLLLAPALPDVPPRPVRIAALGLGRLRPGYLLRSMDTPLELLARSEGHLERTQDDPLMTLAPLTLLTGVTSLAVAATVWDGLPTWTTPTLVIHGTGDQYTAWSGSRRLVDGIAATEKSLELVPDGWHELLDDLEGDRVLAMVLGWVDRWAGDAGER